MPEEIAEPMSDNEALRRIVANMAEIEAHIKGTYDDIIASTPVTISTASQTIIRAAQPLAVKTVVSNIGSVPAHIYEDGALIAYIPANESAELPLRAAGELKGIVLSGNNLVTVSTYIRNA